MTRPGSGYDEYLTALRDLDNVRAAQDQASAVQRDQRTGIDTTVERLWQRLSDQRDQLNRLAVDCGLPAVPTQPTPTPPPADPQAELTIAVTDVDSADTGYADAHYLAHRPKFLPRWRADDRNGLIYGLYALLSLFAQVGVLASAAGTESLGDMIVEVLTCVALPLPAWAAGWLTIGVVSRPVLGEGTLGPNGKLVRNPRLGAVICFSTLVVSCALGNIYLN
ncbi:hypothetical protein [Stackebrandtia nassauensis]|uniref:Uncharacterized protein n=1 Tax=Stackebrandtia nassauensis (strain DSM 44728 / CIP 108903 / NRRL B-16338 / NBRC 102104 / LLR-40K-21) TaxID=446470 RepID=D3Q1N0_STANL|nr:hypothetical protein [Stackebrandtia nassauensis]ADD39878.1 hypothetical protein Snas_0158 [Stackebrandtia nassauensis DSM 44728]